MYTIDPMELKKWEHNPKTQSHSQRENMIKKYREAGQLTAFLVMPDNTILGGNHGLDAVIELGYQAKCIPVDFVQEGDEFFFVNDGETHREIAYKSKEEGMLRISTIHNERFSQYDEEALINLAGSYNVDIGNSYFDFEPLKSFNDIVDQKEKLENLKKYQVIVECHNDVEQQETNNKLTELGYICKVK